MGLGTLIAAGVIGSLGFAGYKAAKATKNLFKWSTEKLKEGYQASMESLCSQFPEANMEYYLELVDKVVDLENRIKKIEESPAFESTYLETLEELKGFLVDTQVSMNISLLEFSKNNHFSQVKFDRKMKQFSKTISKITVGVEHISIKVEQG